MNQVLAYPRLARAQLGVANDMTGVQQMRIEVPPSCPYDFTNELRALSMVQAHAEKQQHKTERKEAWLKTRAEKRRQREINALRDLEKKQKERKQKEREERARQAAAALAAQQQRERELERTRRAEAEAKQKAEAEAKQKKIRDERNRINMWHNTQLDVCGRLLQPQEIKELKNFKSLCGQSDDKKCMQLMQLTKWDINAAVNSFYAHCGNLDACIQAMGNRTPAQPPPPPQQATPQTWISIKMPDNRVTGKMFMVTDTLWALYTHVAETLGRSNFEMLHLPSQAKLTYPESRLNQTFQQAQLTANGVGQVQIRLI